MAEQESKCPSWQAMQWVAPGHYCLQPTPFAAVSRWVTGIVWILWAKIPPLPTSSTACSAPTKPRGQSLHLGRSRSWWRELGIGHPRCLPQLRLLCLFCTSRICKVEQLQGYQKLDFYHFNFSIFDRVRERSRDGRKGWARVLQSNSIHTFLGISPIDCNGFVYE